jgi:hypothetical protein
VQLQPTGVDWESTIYIEIAVAGTTLSPREELTASPYAVNSHQLRGKTYTTAGTAPSSPATGDLWFDSGSGTLNVWSGTLWDQVSSGVGAGSISVSNGGVVVEAAATQVEFSTNNFRVISNPAGVARVSYVRDPLVPAFVSVDDGGVVAEATASTINFTGAQFDVSSSPTGQANVTLNASSVTMQGNSFGGANQLVKLDSSGGLAVNGWATVTKILTATKSVNFASVNPGQCQTDAIGVPGARDADVVMMGIPNSMASIDKGQVISAYVSSDDVVTLRRCNPCAVIITCPDLTAVSAVVRVDVLRH